MFFLTSIISWWPSGICTSWQWPSCELSDISPWPSCELSDVYSGEFHCVRMLYVITITLHEHHVCIGRQQQQHGVNILANHNTDTNDFLSKLGPLAPTEQHDNYGYIIQKLGWTYICLYSLEWCTLNYMLRYWTCDLGRFVKVNQYDPPMKHTMSPGWKYAIHDDYTYI